MKGLSGREGGRKEVIEGRMERRDKPCAAVDPAVISRVMWVNQVEGRAGREGEGGVDEASPCPRYVFAGFRLVFTFRDVLLL